MYNYVFAYKNTAIIHSISVNKYLCRCVQPSAYVQINSARIKIFFLDIYISVLSHLLAFDY